MIKSTERFIRERKLSLRMTLTVFSFFCSSVRVRIISSAKHLAKTMLTTAHADLHRGRMHPFITLSLAVCMAAIICSKHFLGRSKKMLVSSGVRFIIWVGQVRSMNSSLSELNFIVSTRLFIVSTTRFNISFGKCRCWKNINSTFLASCRVPS